MAGAATEKGLYMVSCLYKIHLIVSAADYNKEIFEWKPWVSVYWRDDGRQHLHQIRFNQEKFKTAKEAEKFGMNAGEMWVDGRLRGLVSTYQSVSLLSCTRTRTHGFNLC